MKMRAPTCLAGRSTTRTYLGAAATLVLLWLSLVCTPVSAGIHACPTATGGTQFQDRPCAIRPGPSVRPGADADDRVGATAARTRRSPPVGLHESWFVRPSDVGYEPLCDLRGCECGAVSRPFENGLPIAVADALYIDGAWFRYESSVQTWQQADTTTDSFIARTELEDAACDVLMSQRTLRLFAESELRTLSQRARDAEDLGRDTIESCDGFSETACQDFEAFMLYQRMNLDLQPLREPRPALDGGDSLLTADP